MPKRVFGHMRTAKAQTRLRGCTVCSGPSLSSNIIIGYYWMLETHSKDETLCMCRMMYVRSLRKHAYSNMLEISPPRTESFQKKKKKKKKTLCMCRMMYVITKTRLFKYVENFTTKNWNISDKINSDILHISAQNTDYGYSLEPPRRGGSNEYPQNLCFEQK